MIRQLLRAKIHRATITHAELHYEGSVTIDEDLLDAAGMVEFEAIHVWNLTRGSRLVTYTLRGPRGSGVVCINGAAAHLNKPKDMVIMACFADMNEEEARTHQPLVVRVDERNRIIGSEPEIAGPARSGIPA